MRHLAVFWLVLLAGVASAQRAPDVQIKLDLRPTYIYEKGGGSTLRWYDALGRHSTVGLRFGLEPGWRVIFNQRLARIENDPDNSFLDEFYLENPGEWRVGKQYLPFGARNLLRQSALAARVDTQLLVGFLPIKIAVCDAGSRNTRGVVARIGEKWGLSFAVGNRFANSATALAQFREPQASLGLGRGYKLAYGADFGYSFAGSRLEGEWVSLRDGETFADRDQNYSDLSFRFNLPLVSWQMTLGWARDWSHLKDFFRVEAQRSVIDKISLSSMVRFSSGNWQDFSLSLRIKF